MRLLVLARDACDALDPLEYERRSAWCERHYGDLRSTWDGDDLVMWWGGDPLVTVDPDLLHRMATEDEVTASLGELPDMPDDPRDFEAPRDVR
jgi:hypothetical protein